MALTPEQIRDRDRVRRKAAAPPVDEPVALDLIESYIKGDFRSRGVGDVPVWDGTDWVPATVSPAGIGAAAAADLTAHVNDASAAHLASAIGFAPAGSLEATTVQAALEELAAEGSAVSALPRVVTVADLGPEYHLDLAGDANVLLVGTMTQDCALTIGGADAGSEYTIEVDGAFTLTLPSGATVSPGAGSSTVVGYSPDGLTYRFFEVATAPAGGGGALGTLTETLAYAVLLDNATTAPTANAAKLWRWVAPAAGKLRDVAVYVGTIDAAAHLLVAAYDTGDAAAGVRTRLWQSGSIAGPGAGNAWFTVADANLTVTAGQQLDLYVVTDSATLTLGRKAINTGALTLPAGFDAVPGGAAPKLAAAYAAGSFTAPATIAEASLTNVGTAYPILGRFEAA